MFDRLAETEAAAEAVIVRERGAIPTVLLRLAGLYDERTAVPTLAEQIARIYERDLESHFYSGNTEVGQSMLHKEDLVDAFRRVVLVAGGLMLIVRNTPVVSAPLNEVLSPACERLTFTAYADKVTGEFVGLVKGPDSDDPGEPLAGA